MRSQSSLTTFLTYFFHFSTAAALLKKTRPETIYSGLTEVGSPSNAVTLSSSYCLSSSFLPPPFSFGPSIPLSLLIFSLSPHLSSSFSPSFLFFLLFIFIKYPFLKVQLLLFCGGSRESLLV